MDPDERVTAAVYAVFRKFRELGSVRQVQMWAVANELKLPVVQQRLRGWPIEWRSPAYHNVLQFLQHPVYAGAYVFGRKSTFTKVVEGRARKVVGHKKPLEDWSVLIRDQHRGYITWDEFLKNRTMLAENAHMKKRADRKSGRGGRALLTGLIRCARCAHMLHVFYGSRAGNSHRYLCRGPAMRGGSESACVGVGGVRVDRAVTRQLLEALPTLLKRRSRRLSLSRSKAPNGLRHSARSWKRRPTTLALLNAATRRWTLTSVSWRVSSSDAGKRL